MTEKIRCDECPYAKDTYPGKVDAWGNHFHICGMTGNIVYTKPRREPRYNGKGWINFPVSGCGLFESAEEALGSMTAAERERAIQRPQVSIFDLLDGGER